MQSDLASQLADKALPKHPLLESALGPRRAHELLRVLYRQQLRQLRRSRSPLARRMLEGLREED